MKKILIIIMLQLLVAQLTYSQKRTLITGIISNAKDRPVSVALRIIDGAFATRTTQEYITKTTDGKFSYEFSLEKKSKATIYINGKLAFIPGTFDVMVSPGDSIHFTISDIKKMGLINMDISGIGSEKVTFLKKSIEQVFSVPSSQKAYRYQTMAERYLDVDKKLSLIDSIFHHKAGKVSKNDLQIIHSKLVDETLEMLLISSMTLYDDSVKTLFDKYIKYKNRILPLLDKSAIEYYGGFRILPYYSILSNGNTTEIRSNGFLYDHPIEYTHFVLKEFNRYPAIKDYLLSDLAIKIFRDKWDSSVSDELYKLYVKNVDSVNPYYNQTIKEYAYIQNNLKVGKPFYDFALPDTNGMLHRLRDFKGKVVVLDFWFTGCSGCKTIVPLLEQVEEDFFKDSVQFISINVDDKRSWLLGIGKYSSKHSLQLYTESQRFDHPIIKFGMVAAYPTFIVLDKNGNIVGIPPSIYSNKTGFEQYIRKLL
ncbi:MAG: TlpA family protein disulfide reductase [Sphingobacterium sp.]|jgi:thiol-disulfide isomerase/thioredoxin|nr:TlpA family protein disulfide reductase [Sphingobacterium sp.]